LEVWVVGDLRNAPPSQWHTGETESRRSAGVVVASEVLVRFCKSKRKKI
jgi:hypothetical protein